MTTVPEPNAVGAGLVLLLLHAGDRGGPDGGLGSFRASSGVSVCTRHRLVRINPQQLDNDRSLRL